MLDFLPIFATPLFKGHLDVPDGALEYWLEMSKREGRDKSNRGGWQSKECIGGPFAKQLQDHLTQSLPDFKFTSMWVNVNREGDENVPHIHPGVDLAVVWYLTDAYGLQLQNPNIIPQFNLLREFSHSEGHVYESIQFEFSAGDILIFPAHVLHSVSQHTGTEPRVSMTGNLKWFPPKTAESNESPQLAASFA